MGANIKSRPSNPRVVNALSAIRRLVRVLRVGDATIERLTGGSSAQLFVLQQLASKHATSMNELAERTMTDQSSVSIVVSKLEQRGLVQRAPSPTDARRVTVHITDAGHALLAKAPSTVQQRLITALETLPQDSLVSLAGELDQLVALLGAAHEPPTFFFEDDATGAH